MFIRHLKSNNYCTVHLRPAFDLLHLSLLSIMSCPFSIIRMNNLEKTLISRCRCSDSSSASVRISIDCHSQSLGLLLKVPNETHRSFVAPVEAHGWERGLVHRDWDSTTATGLENGPDSGCHGNPWMWTMKKAPPASF